MSFYLIKFLSKLLISKNQGVYPGRHLALFGAIRGCNWARNVMARDNISQVSEGRQKMLGFGLPHMMKQAAKLRSRELRHILYRVMLVLGFFQVLSERIQRQGM
jgi:hypothetical protein